MKNLLEKFIMYFLYSMLIISISTGLSAAELLTGNETIENLIKTNQIKIKRPKIGLALGGGGAKGSAHIGVIRVLEEMNIPIDYVAGTSMGAYVAGMVAMGLSSDEIEERMFATDWMAGYSDKIERSELSYRNKKIRDKFQIETDIGFNGKEVSLPSGYIQGETMAMLLRQSTKNLPNFDNFDDMPIPLRTVALDLGAMQPYVFTGGNLVTAMQASMAVPGALKPIEHDGKMLADGGIVNNLPVDVLKEMGADIVIAVDIGSDLNKQSQLTSYLAIAGQLITHMTNTSTRNQIAKMSERDILIKPDVSHIGTGSFDQVEDGLPLGFKAANALRPQLVKLSLSQPEYLSHRQTIKIRKSSLPDGDLFIANRVEIISDAKLDKKIISMALRVKAGASYSREQLEKNIKNLYSQDLYERVDYEFEKINGENILKVYVKEKSWGPGFFDMMLSVEESIDGNTDVAIGGAYTLTDINRLGAEWRTEAILGTRTEFRTEFYTPLDNQQLFFWDIATGYNQQERNFYLNGLGSDRNVEFLPTDYSTYYTDTKLGWNITPWAVTSFGYKSTWGNVDLIGINGDTDFTSHGPFLRFGLDTLDNIYFPTSGHSLELKIASLSEDDKSIKDSSNTGQLEWLSAFSSDNHSLAFNIEAGGTESILTLPTLVQDLGGYRNLSGFNKDEISGRYKAFGALLYNYRLAQNDFGAFKFPAYLGISIERGNVWNVRKDIELSDTISAASISLGIDSNIGPAIVAYGRTSTGEESVYFFLGTVF